MSKPSRFALAVPASLALIAVSTSARAAVYELASEWMTISFKDGDKDKLLFTHLPDADVFFHMKDYLMDTSSKAPTMEMFAPLQELARTSDKAAADGPGPAQSLVLTSHPTPYKMLIRFDTLHHEHVIERAPDFTTTDSTTSATLLSVFGVTSDHPENFLVMVQSEGTSAPSGGLSDIELAAVNSMEAAERTTIVASCGGEPGTSTSLDCWRDKIKALFIAHKAEAPGQPLSAFEQRYLRNRLSKKGYEQFQSLRSDSDNGDKLSLASNWHETILSRDIAANAAATVVATSSAPVKAAGSPTPHIPPAKIKSVKTVSTTPPAVASARPASPETSAPKIAGWKKAVLGVVVVGIGGAVVFGIY